MRIEICINYLLSFAIKYYIFIKRNPVQYYYDISIQFFKIFLNWICDQRQGKDKWRQFNIKYIILLEIFWKWYFIIYKLETGQKIDNMIII
jgi:hypothetical protein